MRRQIQQHQGVGHPFQGDHPLLLHSGGAALIRFAEDGLGVDQVNLSAPIQVGAQFHRGRSHRGRQFPQNPLDFQFQLLFRHGEGVGLLHQFPGFDVQGGPAGGNIVHDPREMSLEIGLDGQNITPPPHGENRILERGREFWIAQKGFQLAVNRLPPPGHRLPLAGHLRKRIFVQTARGQQGGPQTLHQVPQRNQAAGQLRQPGGIGQGLQIGRQPEGAPLGGKHRRQGFGFQHALAHGALQIGQQGQNPAETQRPRFGADFPHLADPVERMADGAHLGQRSHGLQAFPPVSGGEPIRQRRQETGPFQSAQGALIEDCGKGRK